jgi:two-component system, NarL family, invasion response regulator UvrY
MLSKTKVALVEDHVLVRQGFAELINGFGNYIVHLEADNGKQFMEKLANNDLPELLLVDVKMPEMDGFQTAEWVKAHYPGIKVITLSTSAEEEAVLKMLQRGALAFLLKDVRKEELKQAMQTVMNGSYYYSGIVTKDLVLSIARQSKGNG